MMSGTLIHDLTHMDNSKMFVISLGGSVICPRDGEIDALFLKRFKDLVLKFVRKKYRFVIVAGGGKICRVYQKAAAKIVKLPYEDMDWLGIHVTRLNAHLLRTIFRKEACPVVFDSPFKEVEKKLLQKPIIIAAGWRPGCSTDFDAVMLAKRFGIKEIINAGNVAFAYDKDPNKHKTAKPIRTITWQNYQKLVGTKWIPGLSAPFDPIAAKEARKSKIRVLILKGTELKNLEKAFLNEKVRGTIIS